MQHTDQHVEAIRPTICVKSEVSASIFDDKVRTMGFVTVAKGKITIDLDSTPSMVTQEATRDFLTDAISLAIKACFDAHPSAFDKH